MFCPSCGTETTTGLKYCNRCGANLSALMHPEVVQVSLTRPATLIGIIMMFLTLGGFALLIAGARILASVINGNDPLIAVIFMGMLTILVVDIFLARQLSKLINAALTGSAKAAPARVAPPITAQQLPRPDTAPFLPASSVTENTTRFLESDYRAPVEPQPGEKQNT
ncbi:MAG: zinc ribbon domain-containing protein [Pyrinomonadaceae bacterium]